MKRIGLRGFIIVPISIFLLIYSLTSVLASAPLLEIATPEDEAEVITGTITVSGTAFPTSPGAVIEGVLVNGELASGTSFWSKTISLNPNTNIIKVEATDNAGDTATKTISVSYKVLTPSSTPSPTPLPIPTLSPSPTITHSPKPTPSPTPAITHSPKPTPSPTPAITHSPKPTPSPTPTITPSSTILSDLIVQDITCWPSNPRIDDFVNVTVTIKNQGSGISPGVEAYLYLFGSTRVDLVPPLDAGETITNTLIWNIGENVEGGEHTIRSVIDPKNEVPEINENNNEKELSLIIRKMVADLTITVKDSRNSNPLKSAEVYIDHDLVGRTDSDGKLTKKVVEGVKHFIRVFKSDYYPKIETVDVGYHVGTKEVTIRLDYAKVPIIIYAEDENRDEVRNAEVFLDGVSIGITDIEGEVTGDATKNKDVMVKVVKRGYYTEDALIHVGTYKEGYSIKLKCEDLTTPNLVVEKMEIVGDNDDTLEVGESVKITYSVKDDSGIKDIKCKLDGKQIDSYTMAGTYTTTTPKLTIGTHVIKFEAIDADINPHKSVKDVSITVSEKGPTVLFQSTKNTINMGENAVFTLGTLNPIGRKNMTVELILKAPSGVSVSSISFVKSGGGMYQATYEIEPGEGMKFITADIIGNELGIHKIEAEVHYSVLDGEVLTQHEMLTLTVIDASMKKKEKGTTPEQGSSGSTTPGFEAIFVIAALFAGVYLVGWKR